MEEGVRIGLNHLSFYLSRSQGRFHKKISIVKSRLTRYPTFNKRRCALGNKTNHIKNFFLVLPIITSFGLIGIFFMFLGVMIFPVIGIFMGLGVFYLGFLIVTPLMSAKVEAIYGEEIGEAIIEFIEKSPPPEESLVMPDVVQTPG